MSEEIIFLKGKKIDVKILEKVKSSDWVFKLK